MEITEGNIRIDTQPVIYIGDLSLQELVNKRSVGVIAREILSLTKRVQALRDEVAEKNERVQELWSTHPDNT